jgi:hypothetical protein
MAGKQARHHHYLSQFYLKGFTNGRSKKSRLTVVDAKLKKRFETIPRNVGGVRDFNRIEIEGLSEDALEASLSEFEGEVATAIKTVERTEVFEGEPRALVLNLIALLAVRSPEMREHMRQFHAQISERILDLALESKERWESQLRQMRDAGYDVNDEISYEDVKEFHERKEYKIGVAREWHIKLEFGGAQAILPYLFGRNWTLFKRPSGAGPFVTSDRPVVLTWRNPEEIPPLFRNSPGYGMTDTRVFFPLSQDMSLLGEFDGQDQVIEANEPLVAVHNTVMLQMSPRIYAPKLDFPFMRSNGTIEKGSSLVQGWTKGA